MSLRSRRLVVAGALTLSGLTLVAASASARKLTGELRRDLAEASSGREGGQQPGSDPNFTGVVTAMEAKDITGGRRTFEAGARTAWHSHDRGQLIFAEKGRMRTGRRNQGFKEYDEGGAEYTPPNVEHWHGATPSGPLVQVNIQFGGSTKWLTKTTDTEYNRK